MYPVSAAYKKAIFKHRDYGVRDSAHVSIYVGEFDPTARPDAALSVPPGTAYSNSDHLNTDTLQSCSYATMEQDFFVLDGGQRFLPATLSKVLTQGWISEAISGAGGVFASPPVIMVQFGSPHSYVGLTLLFDDAAGAYASEFTVATSLNGTAVATHAITNDAARYEGLLQLAEHDALTITFTKTARPYQRIHLQQILFGIGYSFSDQEIISVSLNRECHPLSMELPQNELSFTLHNEDGRFDVDGTSSQLAFFRTDQAVTAELGQTLEDGSIEWVPGGKFKLASWESKGIEATFKCESPIKRLNAGKYSIGDYGTSAVRARIDAVMADAGITNYDASDPALAGTQAVNALPQDTHAACLQLLSNLAMCTMEEDPDTGAILFRNRETPTVESLAAGTPPMDFSAVGNLTSTDTVIDYASMEENFFALDGGQRFLPESGYLNDGCVWDGLPINGAYASPPKLTADFSDNATFGSMILTFSAYSAPSAVRVTSYRTVDGVRMQIKQKTYACEGASLAVTDLFDRVSRVEIEIVCNTRAHRARVQRLVFGWDTGFALTGEDILGGASGEQLPQCRDIRVILSDMEAAESTQLVKKTIAAGDWVRLTHSMATNITAACETAGAVVEIEAHAYCTDVKVTGVTGDVEITLTGQKLTADEDAAAITSANLIGEDAEIDNPLVDSSVLPAGYGNWAKRYFGGSSEWTVPTLGFPEVQPADRILYKGQPAVVLSANLTVNGGASRETFLIRKEGS